MESNTFDPRLALDTLMFQQKIRNLKRIAEKANVAPSSLTRFYNGEGDSKVKTLQKISATYGIPLSELIRYGEASRKANLN